MEYLVRVRISVPRLVCPILFLLDVVPISIIKWRYAAFSPAKNLLGL